MLSFEAKVLTDEIKQKKSWYNILKNQKFKKIHRQQI